MKKYKRIYLNKTLLIFFVLSLIIFLSFCASAQEEKKESEVNIQADNVTYDKSTDKMVFEGNVIIIQEDITLTAQGADFDVDKKIGQIKGDIKLVQSDITITGETLEAFLNDKKYIFQEKVILIQERKDKEDKEDNITWNCNNLEIFTETKDLTATGEVKILKKDYTITAEVAVYNDKEQKITLTGKVRIDEEGGRWITGEKAVFYIDSERLEVEGNVRSGIKLD
ncbi:MAG: LPS export ABC transporter periplasmic protein LptC [Chloroflexi bacterium]|nr:LPS export ABC transporter periplasmic protein LptC [Chloroflexota bacterium]MBE3127960.1 LPS export ABC transporter periplasmic protein LptC [Candidatus Atribacteria bacterium]